MPIELPALPCDPVAFSPHLSVEQVAQHRREQQLRIDAVNATLGDDADAPEADLATLARTARGVLAAQAAQAWSDAFYWSALRAARPEGEHEPAGKLLDAINATFGDARRMRERFDQAARTLTGPGWTWLVQRRGGQLAVFATPQSTTPLTGGDTPLLACCLWPHASAQDYGDARERYLAAFWQLVDWTAVGQRLR